jgi:hypothetical protein
MLIFVNNGDQSGHFVSKLKFDRNDQFDPHYL